MAGGQSAPTLRIVLIVIAVVITLFLGWRAITYFICMSDCGNGILGKLCSHTCSFWGR